MGRRKPKYVKTPAEIAEACGVALRTAQLWVRRQGFPEKKRLGWIVGDVKEWALRMRSAGAEQNGRDDLDLGTDKQGSLFRTKREEIKLRAETAQAEKRELELAQMRGELIRKDEVEQLLVDCAAGFRRDLLALCRRLTPRLVNESDPVEIRRKLEAAVTRALKNWSREL